MTEGKTLYENNCAICHKSDGKGMPPAFPALKGSKIATGPVLAHIATVLYGRPHTAMKAFKDTLNDEDIAAIITYERNAWGNNTGDVVQPAQVKAARHLH